MTTRTTTNQSGFTLLELLLVIGVAALLLIGGIATYRLVSEGNRTTESTRMMLTIRQQGQVMAQQQGGLYTGLTFTSTPATPNSPFVSAGVLTSGQRNPFNGDITIAPTNASGVADDGLSVTFANLPRSACTKLFLSITNPAEIVSVSANGGSARIAANSPNAINATNAGTDCNTDSNTVEWILK